MKTSYLLLILLFSFFSHQGEVESEAQDIINKAIEQHGGSKYQSISIDFDFRDKHYRIEKNDGLYTYERSFFKEKSRIRDVLTNHDFQRTADDKPFELDEKKRKAYSNSVNSVCYFALLPYGLNDPSVIKRNLGKTTIKGKTYHKIEITFKKEGGGEDYSDIFVYWINTKTFFVDFLAYSYHTDGGGLRFREAINRRVIKEITFQDYINYKASPNEFNVYQLDSLYRMNQLTEVSRIELKNIK